MTDPSQGDHEKEPRESRPDERGERDEFPGVDELLGHFLSEPSLWPVLIVMLGSGGAFGAAALILAVVDHNPFAGAALLLIVGMSVDVGLRARRQPGYRNIARLIGLVWASALGFAALAVWTGLAFG